MSHDELKETIAQLDLDCPSDVFATLDPADVEMTVTMSVEDAETLVTAASIAASDAREDGDDDLHARLLSARAELDGALDDHADEVMAAATEVAGDG